MAAAPPVNRRESKTIATLDPSAHSIIKPNSPTMDMARPKSAKGRMRPNRRYSQNSETFSYQQIPAPLLSPSSSYGLAGDSPGLPTETRPAVQGSPVTRDEVPKLLPQQLQSRSFSSLNRYRVLPSIGRRGSTDMAGEPTAKQITEEKRFKHLHGGNQPPESGLTNKGSGEASLKVDSSNSESLFLPKLGVKHSEAALMSSPSFYLEEPSEKEPRTLLAVRSPSGHRFEHFFRPTDTLQRVLTVAETKNNACYKNCIIETTEVPRRSFSNLSSSLEECRIHPKSVLCILQEEDD
nr:PREDICTED: UBX domain-containing protein 10 isoform X2 [Latimeria chalumnae]XP_014353875.1 PREDICTED: UBX domain-containing protein 10 isoform X2 [Latimeria chalumnae]|eukprot:XP_005988772.1 PREDICTED: UBX domain-containing protein 10 isoform X2 [Latimeria chalumnae]